MVARLGQDRRCRLALNRRGRQGKRFADATS
jgi:hypothetical protein